MQPYCRQVEALLGMGGQHPGATPQPSLHNLAILFEIGLGSQRFPINEALGNHSSRTLGLLSKYFTLA
jgi:hypothetical protein